MSTTTTYQYLEPRPGSSYRQLFIKGTRIRAEIIFSAAYQRGDEDDRSPEQVAEDFGIPLEAVHEAIRYCESKPVEIAYDHRQEDLLIEAHGMNHPDYPRDPQKNFRILTTEERAEIDRKLKNEFGI